MGGGAREVWKSRWEGGGSKNVAIRWGGGGGAWIFSGIIQYSKPQTQNSNSPPLRWNLQIRMMLTN